MQLKHSITHKLFVFFVILSSKKLAGCNPITNSNLNDHIRDFSLKNDNINSTRIKTLQKEEPGRYANFAPVRNPVRFKEAADSAISSSSYSRGLLHHDHPGYAIHDYDDTPHIGYGYEYHIPDSDHVHHGVDHHVADHYHGHHGGHHYHHKQYDHALAAKTILWPIAGIALLGAAAALVSNPILLQLGVVSGRRKRRDTEEILDSEFGTDLSWLKTKIEEDFGKDTKVIKSLTKKHGTKQTKNIYRDVFDVNLKKRVPKMTCCNSKQEALFKKVYPTAQSPIEGIDNIPRRYFNSKETHENKLIPVPLIVKENT